MNDFLKALNSVQKDSVICSEGPVIIIAGAGSGKTRVLMYRVAYLISKGISPFNILALTFTNKAAKEMKIRIEELVPGLEARNTWIGTFHSIFARILRIESDRIGYPSNFTIYDTIDSKSQLKAIIRERGLDDKVYKPSLVLNRISLAKNNLISPESYLNDVDLMKEDQLGSRSELGEIYKTYVDRCFKAGAMDFDDLLFKMNFLLAEFPEVLHQYQQKFKYVLIDEFQDTNLLQYSIVKKLAAKHENICVVGDDAQSIYAFRGANIQNILNFKRDYSDLKTFKLEQNYRSTKNIVNAANSVIANNKKQLHKEVWTDNEEGEKLTVLKSYTDNEEGAQVAHSIFECKANKQVKNIDFAILYRTNSQSRAIEEALRKNNIPYRIYGGLSFYQRKEIKDLLAYFRLALNNKDEESLKRVINYPVRGIGLRSMEKISVAANENKITPWEVIENLSQYNLRIGAASVAKIFDFVSMIKSFSADIANKNAYDLGNHIATSSGILKELYDSQAPEDIVRYENVQELLNGLKEFCETWSHNNAEGHDLFEGPSLTEYIQDIALLTDADEDDPNDNDKVSLMTIHAAKGLEFPYVFVVGLEENLFPSQLSLNSKEDLEEERRLFYVAITRARERAFLSFATTRYRWGNLIHCEPSRFLEEVDDKYLDFPATRKISEPLHIFDNPAKLKRPAINEKSKKTNTVKSKLEPLNKKLVRLNKAIRASSNTFETDNTDNLQAGMEVEHQRFGIGKVLQIEGDHSNQKATVFFQATGQKQLLLKFAKLKILNGGSQ